MPNGSVPGRRLVEVGTLGLLAVGVVLLFAPLFGAPTVSFVAGAVCLIAIGVLSRLRPPDYRATAERVLGEASKQWSAATFERRYANHPASTPYLDAARAVAAAHGYHEVADNHPSDRRSIWLRFAKSDTAGS